MAAVVLLTTLVVFIKDDNFLSAKEQPVNEDITSTQPEVSDINNDYPKDIRLTESQRKMCDNNNDFACNLLRTIYKQKKDNRSIIMSPISVSYVLGMLNEGADGETRQQITDVLGLDASVEEINEYFKKMMDDVSKVDKTVTIKTANCIGLKSGISIIPQYKADMQQYYNAQIGALDIDKINNWCKTHTDGMIPQILEGLNPNDVMCLLNVICFNATWKDNFDPEKTRNMKFTKRNGKTVKRKMMHRLLHAAYGKNNLCKMLRLPYGCDSYSLYVLLPNKGKTIDDIIRSLSAEKLEQQRERDMTFHEVDILLPRFTTESETDLIPTLSAMGMTRAFGGAAEFPNMAQGHKDDLYVSMMMQKAKIEVEEEGTKAAAVTIAMLSLKSAELIKEKPKIMEFHAKRPFVYYIIENNTGTIFFMGTYCGD